MYKTFTHKATLILMIILIGGVLSAQDSRDISVQFGWFHSSEYAGFYLAEEEGLYEDAGLNVELLAGGFDEDGNFIFPPTQVLAGEADFGITAADQILAAREQGQPLVAIATIFQRSPVVVITMPDSGIVNPEDLAGKTIPLDTQTTTGLSFVAMLAEFDLTVDDLNVVPRSEYFPADLVSGEIDAFLGFVTDQAVLLEEEGYEINTMFPSDYAIDIYANTIFTTEDMIENEPDVVEAFLAATLAGIQASIDDPVYAAEVSIPYGEDLDLAIETASMYRSLPLLNPAGSVPGMMDAVTWEIANEILLDAGILTEEQNIDEAYTMQFLDAIYADSE